MTEPNACPSPTPYERLRWHYGIPEALLNDFMAQVRASSASAGATPEPHPLRDWNLLSRETQDHDCTLGAEAMIDERVVSGAVGPPDMARQGSERKNEVQE